MMSEKLQTLLQEIHKLEKAVEEELHRAQQKVSYNVSGRKIWFKKDILKLHRSLKKGIVRYLIDSNFLFILTSPMIYAMVLPAIVLDCFCSLYQAICFPVYCIPKVKRGDYIRMDRHKLAYLNGIEKVNCDFCAYFNGSVAYAREIASRTEQYWCPIRHALAIKGAHPRYTQFLGYGDAESYRSRLAQLRMALEQSKTSMPT